MSFDAASSPFSKWSNNIVFSLIWKKIASNFFEFFNVICQEQLDKSKRLQTQKGEPFREEF